MAPANERTNTELPAAEVALPYKKLWLVEHCCRACKSLLATRPIYHRRDETIRGHVFCSFLALLLRHELQARLAARGHDLEWAEVLEDLERVQYVEVEHTNPFVILLAHMLAAMPPLRRFGRQPIRACASLPQAEPDGARRATRCRDPPARCRVGRPVLWNR
jgi:hypothetical protein